jgi:hypothetical protein
MELKAAYDAVMAAHEAAQQVALEIEALFEAGKTDEALALREKWNAAKTKAEAIKSLYDEMAGTVNTDIARKFVPAAKPREESKEKAKVMSRTAFEALTPKAQMGFINADGKIVDELEEVSNG